VLQHNRSHCHFSSRGFIGTISIHCLAASLCRCLEVERSWEVALRGSLSGTACELKQLSALSHAALSRVLCSFGGMLDVVPFKATSSCSDADSVLVMSKHCSGDDALRTDSGCGLASHEANIFPATQMHRHYCPEVPRSRCCSCDCLTGHVHSRSNKSEWVVAHAAGSGTRCKKRSSRRSRCELHIGKPGLSVVHGSHRPVITPCAHGASHLHSLCGVIDHAMADCRG